MFDVVDISDKAVKEKSVGEKFHEDFISVAEQMGGNGRYLFISFQEIEHEGQRGVKVSMNGNVADPIYKLAVLEALESILKSDAERIVKEIEAATAGVLKA